MKSRYMHYKYRKYNGLESNEMIIQGFGLKKSVGIFYDLCILCEKLIHLIN